MINPIFFKIFKHIKCTAELVRGAFFFALFSKNLAKKFIFGAIFATNRGGSLGTSLITNHSFCAPESLGA